MNITSKIVSGANTILGNHDKFEAFAENGVTLTAAVGGTTYTLHTDPRQLGFFTGTVASAVAGRFRR